MSNVKHVRTSDATDFFNNKTSGFVVRKNTVIHPFFHYFVLFAVTVLGISVLVVYQSIESCLATAGIGVCLGLVVSKLENLKKILQKAEFMNALFSSALSKNYLFCSVVSTSGNIVYSNRPFQTLFPNFIAQPKRDLATLLDTYQVTPELRAKVSEMVEQSTEGSLNVIINGGGGMQPQPITLILEPIERPTGFVMIRGKQ